MTARDPERGPGTVRPAPDREPRVPDETGRRFGRGEPAPANPALPPRHEGWRDEVIGVAGLNAIAGIWLIISPWIVGYQTGDAYWNPIICGAIVLVLALARMASPADTRMLSMINALVGVWLFISGFWLAESAGASWNVWILGVIVFVLAAIGSGAGGRRGAEPAV